MTTYKVSKMYTVTAADATIQIANEFKALGNEWLQVLNQSDTEKVFINWHPSMQGSAATVNGDDQYVILPGMFRIVPYGTTWRVIGTGNADIEISEARGV